MRLVERIARRVGIRRVRYVVAAALAVPLLLVVALSAAYLMQAPGWSAGIDDDSLHASKSIDADGDGLADAVENRLGSDPDDPTTLGDVSDGWLMHWYGPAIDWNDTSLLDTPVLVPPAQNLPSLRGPDAPDMPRLAELHALESAWRNPSGAPAAWWTETDVLDPREWDNDGDGVADAWLVAHGIDPLSVPADTPAPGDVTMTLRQKHDLGLDPTRPDTDRDGLGDADELAGSTVIAGRQRTFEPTDPRLSSTRGDDVGDGYLVRFGLDPHDADAADRVHTPGGLTVREAFQVTRDACTAAGDGACDWAGRLATGPLVDPTSWDSLGDGVPDAWALRDPHGIAHPLVDARQIVLATTDDLDAVPWTGDAGSPRGVVVDEENPAPAPFELTAADAYGFLRPSDWDESGDGPWWGGLPTVIDTPEGALPPAVALRGWNITVDVGLGRNGTSTAPAEDLATVRAGADPRKADTDGDGLTDVEEYYGLRTGGHRTDPNSADTDGDGLSDSHEMDLGTHPLRRDTSGSFLADGLEYAYWTAQHQNATAAQLGDADAGDFSRHFAAGLLPPDLGPLGDVDGDGVVNILDDDSDGDGLLDGEERLPNRFLRVPSRSNPRPVTDPALADTDGDGLPDVWEVQWSQDIYWKCSLECTVSGSVPGWPLDPTRPLSVDGTDHQTDWDVSLSSDTVDRHDQPPREFTNAVAYAYDLHPFRNDTNGDGITDLFAVHWGFEAIATLPQTLQEAIRGEAWPETLGQEIRLALPASYSVASDLAVIHPRAGDQSIDASTNLLGTFAPDPGARKKGTWVADSGRTYDPDGNGDPDCLTDTLPGQTNVTWHAMREEAYSSGTGADGIPDRGGLHAPCWTWVEHDLRSDIGNRTNPWRHDTDGDGLPDAWALLYGVQSALDTTPSSRRGAPGGCDDAGMLRGLPERESYCLDHRDAYQHGLDPTVPDTDGGGLVDWIEIALELDPLDPLDDAGGEDWDGDGLINSVEDQISTNRLTPDTDGDGLMDGDLQGAGDQRPFHHRTKGFGDLCVRGGDDNVTASDGLGGMNNRRSNPTIPGDTGGNLTHTQRLDFLRASGVLSRPTTQADTVCDDVDDGASGEAVHELFLREGTAVDGDWDIGLNTPTLPAFIGAGASAQGDAGTNSTRLDTSGDGLPDGWVVHHGRDPTRAIGGDNTDADPLTNLEEYQAHRPTDWNETRDGPWWGGLDPTTPDTDGDEDWYVNRFHAFDGRDVDNDGDGVPWREDPHPGMDPLNAGIVAWNASDERYTTDHALLWQALAARPLLHLADTDGDTVPDWLDRARVRVEGLQTDAHEIEKGGSTFQVSGTVVVDEPEPGWTYSDLSGGALAADGDPVQNATVRAVLRDQAGRESTVAYGFTDASGAFSLVARVAGTTLAVADPPDNASVAGHLVGEGVPVPTDAASLEPGPTRLAVLVEPNHPNQPVRFGGAAAAVAYKRTSDGAPFVVPTHERDPPTVGGLQALNVTAGEPNATVKAVRHDAEAVFAARAEHASDLDLNAQTRLRLQPPAAVLVGKDIPVEGDLVDDESTGLPGHTVRVELRDDVGDLVGDADHETGDSGVFNVTFSTSGLAPGDYTIHAAVTLGEGTSHLLDPLPAEEPVTLKQDTAWLDVRVDGRDIDFDGLRTAVDASSPLRVQARLVDHQGLPVAGRDVSLILQSIGFSDDANADTNETGWIDTALDPLDPTQVGLQDVSLTLRAHKATAADDAGEFTVNLQPRFPTRIRDVENATADVGDVGLVGGVLVRVGADGAEVPVEVDHPGAIAASSVLGDAGADVTGADGHFQFPATSDHPGRVAWTVRFAPHVGGDPCTDASRPVCFLSDSPPVHANSTHVGGTVLAVEGPEGLRGSDVPVQGRLQLPDGEGVAAFNVTAHWTDTDEGGEATTDEEGRFSLSLPARDHAAVHEAVVRFLGADILHASTETLQVPVRVPVSIVGSASDTTVDVNASATYVHARLQDEKGQPLPGRTVQVALVRQDGTVTFQRERTTGASGNVSLDLLSHTPPTPGPWTARLHYAGAELESNATWSGEFRVRHVVRVEATHAPATVEPGHAAVLRGTTQAASTELGTVTLTATMGGRTLGTTDAAARGDWSLHFTGPQASSGLHAISVTGEGPDGVRVEGTTVHVFVPGLVTVHLDEIGGAGGRTVQVTAKRDGDPAPGLEIVLARHDPAGRLVGIHPVTTESSGAATLRLDAGQAGELSVLSLSDPDVRVLSVSHDLRSVPARESGLPPWSWWLAGAIAAVSVALLVAYAAWRRRGRRDIEDVLAHARAALMDPHASPRDTIRAAYASLLHVMARAGYRPREEETVRDIAGGATAAFGLPGGPMRSLSVLFEAAVYSEAELTPQHRRSALACLHRLTDRVPDRSNPRGRETT